MFNCFVVEYSPKKKLIENTWFTIIFQLIVCLFGVVYETATMHGLLGNDLLYFCQTNLSKQPIIFFNFDSVHDLSFLLLIVNAYCLLTLNPPELKYCSTS